MLQNSADATQLRLLRQLTLTSGLALGVLGSLDLVAGFSLYGSVQWAGVAILGLSFWLIQQQRVFAAAQIFMVTTEALLFLVDDGFNGQGRSWILHMPILAALYGLFPERQKRWRFLWMGVSVMSLAIVNLTDASPRWNGITARDPGHLVSVLNFAVAAATLVMVLTILERRFLEHYGILERMSGDLKTALAEAEQASEAKSRLLSHVSHEFRTPLNAISGFAQILRTERHSPSESAENLESIQRSADHLVHLVNNMLDLARIEHGSLELAQIVFDPVDKVDEVIALLHPTAQEKGLTLEARIDGEIETVEGDPVRLSQILINLAGNAVKYTESGSIVLSLRKPPGSDDKLCHLRFEISDTGPGIPEAQQSVVFERFSRLAEHQTTGSGLGLAICRELADRMGGQLGLRSRPGEGSTFTLDLSLRAAPLPSAGSASDSWTRRPLAGKRLLLCDDNRVNLRLASQVLRRMGVDFDVAESGREALGFLERTGYDLLLLDLHMPEVDGFQVTERLHSSDGPNRTTPILALTADSSESTRARCLALGMSGFALKPIHLQQLELQIRGLLQEVRT